LLHCIIPAAAVWLPIAFCLVVSVAVYGNLNVAYADGTAVKPAILADPLSPKGIPVPDLPICHGSEGAVYQASYMGGSQHVRIDIGLGSRAISRERLNGPLAGKNTFLVKALSVIGHGVTSIWPSRRIS
jgi:hypothetical protein